MHHSLYVHIVWTTRDRARLLVNAALAEFVWRFIRAVAAQERAKVMAAGLVQTHIHLIVRLHPTTDISRLLQRIKGGSSSQAGKEGHSPANLPLKWAKGYSIHSVSRRNLSAAIAYVRGQATRHPDEVIPGWRGNEV